MSEETTVVAQKLDNDDMDTNEDHMVSGQTDDNPPEQTAGDENGTGDPAAGDQDGVGDQAAGDQDGVGDQAAGDEDGVSAGDQATGDEDGVGDQAADDKVVDTAGSTEEPVIGEDGNQEQNGRYQVNYNEDDSMELAVTNHMHGKENGMMEQAADEENVAKGTAEAVQDGDGTMQLETSEQVDVSEMDVDENGTVEQVIQSQAFRAELESMVAEQISAHQPLSDLVSLRQRYRHEDDLIYNAYGPVIPVADIRGVDTLNYTKGEKLFRCKVASCYRLMELFAWTTDLTSGCVTAHLDDDSNDQYLVAPDGLMCDEVTASSLAKVLPDGTVTDRGSTGLSVDTGSLALHMAVYSALKRTDIKAIIHLTNAKAITVSMMKCGLMPLCPEAMTLGDVSYYDYCGGIYDQEDRDNLAEALGPTNKILFLRNCGALVCGGSIEECFQLAFNVMAAINTQLTLAAFGLNNCYIPSDEMRRNVYENSFRPPSGTVATKRRWRRGELEFEAMMRQLDNAGYQTGYSYHVTSSSRMCRDSRSNSEADITPALLNSFGGSDRELSRFGSPHRAPRLPTDRQASPNVYQQVVVERGSQPAKNITKWVPRELTPIPKSPIVPSGKIEKPNQFAPQGINPAELKEKVKAIRKDYYTDKVTAGPQSKILEGINWDEAQTIQDSFISGTSDSVSSGPVVAASKGVIQREHQRGATVVCKTVFYPPNPFNRMSEDDIEEYRSSVERRSRSGSVEPAVEHHFEPNPAGYLVSTEERLDQVRRGQGLRSDQVSVQSVYAGGDAPPSEQEIHAIDAGSSEA